MNDKFSDLYNKFLDYVNNNDEEGARRFLVDNLQKFPQETQDKLIFAFFEDALMGEARDIKKIAKMQEQGLDAISQIEKAKKILEDQRKIEELRSGLTK